MHLRQIGFVLRTGGSARADGITEVKRRKARHHRVKIDDAHRVTRRVIDQNVAHFRVVVRHLQRQLAFLKQVHQKPAVRFACLCKFQLVRNIL